MLGANCYMVGCPETKDCLVVDIGGDGEAVAQEIKELHWNPKVIFCTHGHFDHIGGIADFRKVFPDAKIYIHPSDADMLVEESKNLCYMCGYHINAPKADVLVKDGDRVLLARKSFWAKGRYGLVAGFVDAGESLEAAACREVLEETGIEIRDLNYVASQYWPFPSQLMVGFTAAYARGDLRVNTAELEDARWFSVDDLPDLPPKLSIARFLLDHFARPSPA